MIEREELLEAIKSYGCAKWNHEEEMSDIRYKYIDRMLDRMLAAPTAMPDREELLQKIKEYGNARGVQASVATGLWHEIAAELAGPIEPPDVPVGVVPKGESVPVEPDHANRFAVIEGAIDGTSGRLDVTVGRVAKAEHDVVELQDATAQAGAEVVKARKERAGNKEAIAELCKDVDKNTGFIRRLGCELRKAIAEQAGRLDTLDEGRERAMAKALGNECSVEVLREETEQWQHDHEASFHGVRGEVPAPPEGLAVVATADRGIWRHDGSDLDIPRWQESELYSLCIDSKPGSYAAWATGKRGIWRQQIEEEGLWQEGAHGMLFVGREGRCVHSVFDQQRGMYICGLEVFKNKEPVLCTLCNLFEPRDEEAKKESAPAPPDAVEEAVKRTQARIMNWYHGSDGDEAFLPAYLHSLVAAVLTAHGLPSTKGNPHE